jgi:hypothetical protein
MNSKYTQAFILLIATLFTAGCSKHYYAPALFKSDVAYQFKPMSTDSVKSTNNISAAIVSSEGYSLSDNLTLGQLSYNRANTFKNLNVSYGAYGFIGSYQNKTIQPNQAGYFDSKSLSGLGFRGSVNTYVHDGNADFRLFGIQASYSKEFGAYTDFRKSAQNIHDLYADGSTSVITVGLTNETVWHGRNPALQYGYRFLLGTVLGNHEFVNNNEGSTDSPFIFNKSGCFSGAGFIQIDHYQAVLEYTNFSTISFTLGFSF